MKKLHLLFLSLTLLILTAEIQARPHLFNIDTIYANADFCDRVEILNYDSTMHILSVKSTLDSLTYSFGVGYFNNKDYLNNKNEFLLIRGDGVVAVGILHGGKWVFNKTQSWTSGVCFVATSNAAAKTEVAKGLQGEIILFPKTYFKFKTPSATWSFAERDNNQSLFNKRIVEIVKLDSLKNHYFNDTIYIKKIISDSKHIVLMFDITYIKNTSLNCQDYMKTLLAALQLPYENILKNSESATCEYLDNGNVFSYSNSNYKLITYTSYYNIRHEEISFLDLYLK